MYSYDGYDVKARAHAGKAPIVYYLSFSICFLNAYALAFVYVAIEGKTRPRMIMFYAVFN